MSQVSRRFELIMDAGNGAQKAGDILVSTFAKNGNFVFIEPMIPAEISPPKRTPYSMSGVVIRISEEDITNIGSGTDLMVFEHEILLERRLSDQEYHPNAHVFLDMGDEARNKDAYQVAIARAQSLGLQVHPFTIDDASKKIIGDLGGNGKNMFYLGMLTRFFSGSKEQLIQAIRTTFKKLPEEKLLLNIKIFEGGFTSAEGFGIGFSISSKPIDGDKILMDGNTAMSLGLIDAGIKLYCGYPITPASSIMHTLAKLFPKYGGLVHQAEDEISAIGSAIGSYYAGVPSATGTSGPGLSLKQEFIGLATATETPLIVIDVQRGGPSTGLPTKTEQSDLPAAIFGSHGDNVKVVLGVSDVIDCFYAPHIARYLAEKLRVPVFIMSDYMISVSYKVVEKPPVNEMDQVEDIHGFILDRFKIKRFENDIEMVKSNQSIPGETGLMRRVTGLNVDDGGHVSNTAVSTIRSHHVRNQKLDMVRDHLLTPEFIGPQEGDLLVVGWGSARGAIEEGVLDCQEQGLRVSGLHLKVVYPLPPMMKDIFKKFKKVMTAEMAYGDENKPAPLAMLLRSQTLVDVISGISEPSGNPLKPSQVITKVKELI